MIIGLTGKRLSGKDTVANYLVEQKGYQHLNFSHKMKEAIAALFDITLEEVDELKGDRDGFSEGTVAIALPSGTRYFTWVEFLQRFGTDMGRKVLGEDLWVDLAYQQLEPYPGLKNFVIKDVRFKNEAEWILELGGKIIELRRDMIDVEHDNHESENGLPDHMAEYVIANTSTIESLYKDVDAVMENILQNGG